MAEGPNKNLEAKAAGIQQDYNDALTRIDSGHAISSLEEAVPVIRQLQKSINELHQQLRSAITENKSGLRKWLRRHLFGEREMALQTEKEATVLHLLNELIEYFSSSTQQMRELLEAQILFFQQITPSVDIKIDQLRNEQTAEMERKLNELWFQINRLRPAATTLKVGDYDLTQLRIAVEELKQRVSPLSSQSSQQSSNQAINFPLARDFRYFVFEEIFRGSSEWLTEKLSRYVPLFLTAPEPVLDIGCGRGEFLQLMKDLKKESYGIELNQYETERLKKKGLNVISEDALDHIQKLNRESIGSVFCAQVVEHLPPEQVFELLSRLNVAMKPGATLVIETVNPLSVFGYHHVYFKDPSHIFPVHPDTLSFLMRYAGFQNIQVNFLTPLSEEDQLAGPDENISDQQLRSYLAKLVEKLNHLLYDHMEYYVAGTRV